MIRKLRSFTILELLVVVSIIVVLVSLTVPIKSAWEQAQVDNAFQQVVSLIKTAKERSEDIFNPAYGVFFYIDPSTNLQTAVYIQGYSYPLEFGEEWEDICDRYRVDPEDPILHHLANVVRVSPYDTINWEVEDLLNSDYQQGKHRNFFGIIFADGEQTQVTPFVLHDPDVDNDGFGDITKLAVSDLQIEESDGILKDVLEDSENKIRWTETSWSFRVYNEKTFIELEPQVNLVPYLDYALTRYGVVIQLRKEFEIDE